MKEVIELYSAADLACMFAVSKKTIWNWVDSGQIPPPNVNISARTKRWSKNVVAEFSEKFKKKAKKAKKNKN